MLTEDVNNLDMLYLERVIDIRELKDYKKFYIEGVTHISYDYFITNPDLFIDKIHKYYILCHDGKKSYNVIKQLQNEGYKLVHLVGGVSSYKKYIRSKNGN